MRLKPAYLSLAMLVACAEGAEDGSQDQDTTPSAQEEELTYSDDAMLIDFGADAPAELAALVTFVALQRGKVPEALARAEKDLNRFAGVGGVRYVLAIVLHACALGSPGGSLDRASFVQRRDQQLDWLEERAPATESLRRQWQQMRAVR